MDVGELTPADFMQHPVWEYRTDQEHLGSSECDVRPVKRLPVRHLVERLVGLEVTLANGRQLWALLGSIDLQDETYTQASIQVTLFHEGKRLYVTRFGQFTFAGLNPDQVARHLGLNQDQVFPVRYNLSGICLAGEVILNQNIAADVKGPLTMDDHLAMILRNAPFRNGR